MNIFVLDYDLEKCAQYHVDRHVVKMVTETAQLLSSAFYFTGEEVPEGIYQKGNANHPCAKWARESLSNWRWLKELGLALYKEYKHRYGDKQHKAGEVILHMPEPNLIDIGLTKHVQAVTPDCKMDDVVEAYRKYYNVEKRHLFAWKKRNIPEWIEQ